ncbi:MAG: hypothetical protein M0T72_00510 [Candidatus Dormibacteraeota bacterium]|nr:hypothetical protein [Candidatus Dormibacteraeota bacterium]
MLPASSPRGNANLPIPKLTRTEVGMWVVYAVVAVITVVVPIISHHLSLADVGAWILVLGAAAMSVGWYRSGALRSREWMEEAEYEEFLKEMQGPYQPPEPT